MIFTTRPPKQWLQMEALFGSYREDPCRNFEKHTIIPFPPFTIRACTTSSSIEIHVNVSIHDESKPESLCWNDHMHG
ncbi:hypothetical protein Pelo_19826 [Pelomyxa schiedti]|nr:hypothetical protein Pelo_19826 [Pelomyxa schiedti]